MDQRAYLDSLTNDLQRITELAAGDLSASVPACPGWDLGQLIAHLGQVHRMALAVISTGALQPAPPASLEAPPETPQDLRAYFSSSAARLLEDLRSTPVDAPSWNFLKQPQRAGFWSRRMAQEHSIHRVDAETAATGGAAPIDGALAVDGIDEYFLIANVRVLPRKPGFELGGTLHLHATDREGEWMITPNRVEDRLTLTVENGHGKGDAAIRGTASDLLLGLWGRHSFLDDRFERFGSASVIDAIAGLGGN